MRQINRLPKPAILIAREVQWLEIMINKDLNRPDPTKYGNPAIRRDLNTMSSTKCFYCETSLKGQPREIDHFIEVSINRNLSYTWENLYLSCSNCNDKLNENVISTRLCLDPCLHTDVEIQQELTFKDEVILPLDDSIIGRNTITKYRLDSYELDMLRIKQLQIVNKMVIAILQANSGGIPEGHKRTLRSYMQRETQYSLMFKVYLEALM